MLSNVQCSSRGATALFPRREVSLFRPIARCSLAALLTLAACAAEPTLSVEVCSDLRVPAELDAVRIVLFDAQRSAERYATVFELIECPAGRLRGLPQVVRVPSPKAAAWLRVEGLRDGIAVISAETRLQEGDGESAPIPVSLEAPCRGQVCPLGQTCLTDACTAAPYHAETPMRCVAAATPEADAGSDSDSEADSDSDSEADSDPEADSDSEADSEADSDSAAEPGPDADSLCAPPSVFGRGGASP
jgi:hypothetical protein